MKSLTSKDPLEASWHTHMEDGQWVPDVSIDNCMVCRTPFNIWRRKHHCRRCGAVVCDPCSLQRTKFTFREIKANCEDGTEARVCDACIQVIDEKLAIAIQQKLIKPEESSSHSISNKTISPSDDTPSTPSSSSSTLSSTSLHHQKACGRAVMSMGLYRAEIKESEGNRYIRNNDL